MLCPRCGQERGKGDFFNESDICYKCIYKEKIEKWNKIEKKQFCRICKKLCSEFRWMYCSKECSLIGESEMKKNYWIRKLKSL